MWALGRFAERFSLVSLIAVGLTLLGAGLAGMAASAAVLPVAAAYLVTMVGYAVLFLTARRGIVELRSAAANQGAAFGLFGLVSDVGNVLGPVIGVVLYEITGRVSFLLIGAFAGLLVAVFLSLAGRWRRSFPAATVTPLRTEVGGEVVERVA
jgi:predicted MFS family arabinose efflux permease